MQVRLSVLEVLCQRSSVASLAYWLASNPKYLHTALLLFGLLIKTAVEGLALAMELRGPVCLRQEGRGCCTLAR